MPAEKSYLDSFKVRNLTNRPITLGDLVNVTIPAGQTVDLLKQPRVTKEKVNQSQHLQIAIRSKWLKIVRTKRQTRTADEKKSSVAWEEDILALNLSSVSDDDILQYNGNTNTWINVQPEDTEGADKNITSVSTNYTILDTDDIILVNAANTTITITLPAALNVEGKMYSIKKIDFSDNIVTLDGNGETIDDEITQELTIQGDSVDLISDTTKWRIL